MLAINGSMNDPTEQSGHVDLGFTLACLLIIGAVAAWNLAPEDSAWRSWWDWPWWAKLGSILVVLFMLATAGAFERWRRFPPIDRT